jgi:hypothetical protein
MPADGIQPGGGRGLAGAATDTDIERALDIARDAQDAKTMRDLRARLDTMMEREGPHVLTRDTALALLRAIADGLKPSTDLVVGSVGEDALLVQNHPALNLLDELIDALVDLENGKTHCAFKPAAHGANASLTIGERKWDDAVLDAVIVVQRAKGFRTRVQAEQFLASNLNKAGKTRRGKRYSAKMLKRLRDDRAKRK